MGPSAPCVPFNALNPLPLAELTYRRTARDPCSTLPESAEKTIIDPSGDHEGGVNSSGSGLSFGPPPAKRNGWAPVSSTVSRSYRKGKRVFFVTAKRGPSTTTCAPAQLAAMASKRHPPSKYRATRLPMPSFVIGVAVRQKLLT